MQNQTNSCQKLTFTFDFCPPHTDAYLYMHDHTHMYIPLHDVHAINVVFFLIMWGG